jgi:hypothetical protein
MRPFGALTPQMVTGFLGREALSQEAPTPGQLANGRGELVQGASLPRGNRSKAWSDLFSLRKPTLTNIVYNVVLG